jgi:hypothetical protein
VNKKELYILAFILCAIGIGFFAYKTIYLKFPVSPQEEVYAWNIEVRIRFDAQDGPVKAYLYIPENTENYTIVNEQFISRGFGMTARIKEANRMAVWSIRKARGGQVLYYHATVWPGTEPASYNNGKTPKLQEVELVDVQKLAAEAILAEVKKRSADIETLIPELLKYLNQPTSYNNDNLRLLLGNKPTLEQKLQLAVNILGLDGIPARVTHGIRLQKLVRAAEKIHLLQVYSHSKWSSYHPITGVIYKSEDYLNWWHGNRPLVSVRGGTNVTSQISVSESHESAIMNANSRGQLSLPTFTRFSLLGLPIDTQAVYRILLTVPIGVFLLVILRNIVGVRTFGTFMPVLIALAFRETQLAWGIILFSLVVGLGLSVRFYLDHLKLLLVPRLASVLVVVIILMASISIVSHKLGLYSGLSVSLFPMVILTMTIERMSIVWEERGPVEALKQGTGSLFVASIAYLVMQNNFVQHLVFIFPELLLVLLAALMLLGRYRGYRLLELQRFKILAQDRESK